MKKVILLHFRKAEDRGESVVVSLRFRYGMCGQAQVNHHTICITNHLIDQVA